MMSIQVYKMLHSLKHPDENIIAILRSGSILQLAHAICRIFELDEVAILTKAWALEMSSAQPFTAEKSASIHAFIDGYYEGKTE